MSAFNPNRFRTSDWCGVLSDAQAGSTLASRGFSRSFGRSWPIGPNTRWMYSALPTCAQRTDDCVGHGTANLLEMGIRFYARPKRVAEILPAFLGHGAVDRWQVRGHRIWRARKDDLGEPYRGGITVDGGFLALIARKVLAMRDAVAVSRSLDDIGRWLDFSPVLLAHKVHHGWGSPAFNGAIDGRPHTPDPMAGHCTVGVQVHEQYHERATGTPAKWTRYLDLLNSWGEPWGWHGIGTLTEEDHDRSALSDSVGLHPPDDPDDEAPWAEGILLRLCEAGFVGIGEEGACA